MSEQTTYDFVCKQGETLSRLLTVTDDGNTAINLTGYSALMQVRKSHRDGAVLLELSSTGGSPAIVIDAALGKLTLVVPKETTKTLPAVNAVYDLFITDGAGVSTRLLDGKFMVSASVTRTGA